MFILAWNRPSNIPSEIDINYTVTIMDSNDNNYPGFPMVTNMTSVTFENKRKDCLTYSIMVEAENDFGRGPPATINNPIPSCKLCTSFFF